MLHTSELVLWQEAAKPYAGNLISHYPDPGRAAQKSVRHHTGLQALPIKLKRLQDEGSHPTVYSNTIQASKERWSDISGLWYHLLLWPLGLKIPG